MRVEAGLTGTIEQIFHEAMSMYGASRVMVASQESHSQRVFVGELNKANGQGPSEFQWLEYESARCKNLSGRFSRGRMLRVDRWRPLDDIGVG